ncbi:MAG: gamma-glutamylcyclotransferase family protein [Sneathiellaceae bacterium]
MMNRLYFAYGMNMDLAAMAERCPAARLICPARLDGHRFGLNRRGVSTVIPGAGAVVHGLLWTLTGPCEAALDGFEGIAAGHYVKRDRPVLAVLPGGERPRRALVYIASDAHPGPPRQPYFDRVRAAARSHGFPEDYLAELDALLPAGALR